MPRSPQFGEWTPERIVGGQRRLVLIPQSGSKDYDKVHPEQAFRAHGRIGFLNHYQTTGGKRSKRALTYGAISIKAYCRFYKESGLEVIPEQTQSQPLYHENIRGSHYYTGRRLMMLQNQLKTPLSNAARDYSSIFKTTGDTASKIYRLKNGSVLIDSNGPIGKIAVSIGCKESGMCNACIEDIDFSAA